MEQSFSKWADKKDEAWGAGALTGLAASGGNPLGAAAGGLAQHFGGKLWDKYQNWQNQQQTQQVVQTHQDLEKKALEALRSVINNVQQGAYKDQHLNMLANHPKYLRFLQTTANMLFQVLKKQQASQAQESPKDKSWSNW
jgi:hypothetical protein